MKEQEPGNDLNPKFDAWGDRAGIINQPENEHQRSRCKHGEGPEDAESSADVAEAVERKVAYGDDHKSEPDSHSTQAGDGARMNVATADGGAGPAMLHGGIADVVGQH